ncbi:TIGR01459 family HAD-type hydrolase [Salmonirosea aquatica]|uniref:TIGR01459 family HAD-type hydrolase n=1 Tax=Salmonirosea aquatica TaxID=2654236 RepID=A0A7C9FZE7_9BACT|nr:TIGR01459 family HAD-type hydrolase [Cytophagaceae bacterium SJW1-29]
MQLDNFKSVVSKYDVIFFDAFGVLKTHDTLIPGIEKTFAYLREKKKDFYVLTNDASRSPVELAASYHRLGLSDIVPECIISSGMLAREYLGLKISSGTVAYLGTEKSAHYIETLGLKTMPINQLVLETMAGVNALVMLDDEGFDWNTDLSKTVNLLRRRNIPVVVANTDRTYPMSAHQVAIAIGGVADMIERIVGKHFIRFGKPDAQMFIFAYEHIKNYPNVSKKDILMVGDTLHTDILGGNKFGLDTALVLTGNTLPHEAELKIQSTGIIPTYICESAVV